MAQARHLFNVALRMIEMTPALAKYCRARTTDMRISCAKTEAYLQAASVRSVRPDSQNATAIICDGTGGFSQRDILSNLAGGGYEVHKKLSRFITFERVDDRWARG
jgi:phage terminase large subunit-like protein